MGQKKKYLMKKTINIAVGADGTGTTFEEIVNATKDGRLNAAVVLLFSNNADSRAVALAREWKIPATILDTQLPKEKRDQILFEILTAYHPPIDLICLAGYLKLIPQSIVEAFPKKIVNSHPALDLTRFGGKGMYGAHVPEAIIKAGLKETGSTIHFVTKIYDDPAGIIAQTDPVPIFPQDSSESVLARQLPLERKLYIEVIKMFADNRLS